MSVLGDSTDLLSRGFDGFERIGRGGSGTVYRARDTRLNRMVAIKVLNGEGSAERIAREAQAQSTLSWHANVLSLHDIGVTPDGSEYMVLELAEGGSLADRVRTHGPLRGEALRRLAAELASALAAAHAAGIVHCDVKPSNVLFAADGSVRLADFGISRALGDTADFDRPLAGSMAFAPRELLEGDSPGPSGDVYGLCATLWFAASGRVPFGGEGESLARTAARAGSSRLQLDDEAGIGAALTSLVNKGLDPDPDTRPSAPALAEAAQRVEPARGPAAASRFRGPSRGVIALLVVLALCATVVVVSRVPAQPDTVTRAQFCDSYEALLRDREALLAEVSADLETSRSPVEVVERLLVRYPGQVASMIEPYLRDARGFSGTPLAVTHSQLAQLSKADVLRTLGGGKAFLFDGESGGFAPDALPVELREPARVFSDANELAVRSCGVFESSLGQAKARLASAIISNLANPGFMEEFFAHPESRDLFDTQTVMLMASMARPFFEDLLAGRWSWFIVLLEDDEEIRDAVTFEHPDLILSALKNEPALLETLQDPEWRADLEVGLTRSSPVEQFGIRSIFGAQLEQLGVWQ